MRFAAHVEDEHICYLQKGATHLGGPLLPGASQVLINGFSAVRAGDRAVCAGAPAPDTVTGGLITVLIEGAPASRVGDPTDKGVILRVGCDNVILGDFPGGPLTPAEAQALYDYLANRKDIPFDFLHHGCEARADRMCEDIAALGIDCGKDFTWPTSTSQNLAIPGDPKGGWAMHVAPTVAVQQPDGTSKPMVMDPSFKTGGPLGEQEWEDMQHGENTGAITRVSTDRNVYLIKNYVVDKRFRKVETSNPDKTARQLQGLREELAKKTGGTAEPAHS